MLTLRFHLFYMFRKKTHQRMRVGEQTLQQACSQEYPGSARCVQSFDDSLDSAIRITYRISLRSSSLREPRHPLLRIVQNFVFFREMSSPKSLKFQEYLRNNCFTKGFKKKKIHTSTDRKQGRKRLSLHNPHHQSKTNADRDE